MPKGTFGRNAMVQELQAYRMVWMILLSSQPFCSFQWRLVKLEY